MFKLSVPKPYVRPLIFAVFLHLGLLLLVLLHPLSSNYRAPNTGSNAVIHAVAVNQSQLNAQMAAVEKQESPEPAPQVDEQQQQKKAAHEAQIVKRQKAEEAKQLAEAKAAAQAKSKAALAAKAQAQAQAEAREEAAQKALQVQQEKLAQQKLQLQQKQKQAVAKQLAQKKAKALQQAKLHALQEQKLAKQKALRQAQLKQQKQLAMKQQQLQQKLLQQQLAGEQKEISETANQQMSGVVDQYKAQVIEAIEQNWLLPNNVDKTLSCEFLIHVAPGGAVLGVKLTRSSGNAVLDRSAETAVYKASPLPVPKDSVLFEQFRDLRLTVSPQGSVGSSS